MNERMTDEYVATILATERMSQAQVAKLLGWGRAKVRRLTRTGMIPHLIDPENGRPYYSRTAITAWLRRSGELVAERAS